MIPELLFDVHLLDESRVAFHFLSSNVAGQLFEIACGQKVNFMGLLSICRRSYGLRAKPRTLLFQFCEFCSNLDLFAYCCGTGLSQEPLQILVDVLFAVTCTVSVI